jgi:hypothetical protein
MCDCESEDLVQVRSNHQHLFACVHDIAPSRLRDFMNQAHTFGVAAYTFECLACFS